MRYSRPFQAQRQRNGKLGERLCEMALRQAGFLLIEKVEAARTQSGIYLKTCSGDFRAIEQGGRSVLVECKACKGNLTRSRFRPHQIATLQAHHEAGGISIVAHVTAAGCRLIPWGEIGAKLNRVPTGSVKECTE
jgi:hypothetical protein